MGRSDAEFFESGFAKVINLIEKHQEIKEMEYDIASERQSGNDYGKVLSEVKSMKNIPGWI